MVKAAPRTISANTLQPRMSSAHPHSANPTNEIPITTSSGPPCRPGPTCSARTSDGRRCSSSASPTSVMSAVIRAPPIGRAGHRRRDTAGGVPAATTQDVPQHRGSRPTEPANTAAAGAPPPNQDRSPNEPLRRSAARSRGARTTARVPRRVGPGMRRARESVTTSYSRCHRGVGCRRRSTPKRRPTHTTTTINTTGETHRATMTTANNPEFIELAPVRRTTAAPSRGRLYPPTALPGAVLAGRRCRLSAATRRELPESAEEGSDAGHLGGSGAAGSTAQRRPAGRGAAPGLQVAHAAPSATDRRQKRMFVLRRGRCSGASISDGPGSTWWCCRGRGVFVRPGRLRKW
jgi:hypothetical protein